MNKTKIPWCDYTINPVKGLCPMACPYCYERKRSIRFKLSKEITYRPEVLDKLTTIPAGSKVFIGSIIDLFHKDTIQYLPEIIARVRLHPSLTFIFLTKQPQNLVKWSPFPDNCWVGVSVDGSDRSPESLAGLRDCRAKIKFISFEPLLGHVSVPFEKIGINWVILGSRTQPTIHPPREWVNEIITAADKAEIPVFVKEPMSSYYNIKRQEFPKG